MPRACGRGAAPARRGGVQAARGTKGLGVVRALWVGRRGGRSAAGGGGGPTSPARRLGRTRPRRRGAARGYNTSGRAAGRGRGRVCGWVCGPPAGRAAAHKSRAQRGAGARPRRAAPTGGPCPQAAHPRRGARAAPPACRSSGQGRAGRAGGSARSERGASLALADNGPAVLGNRVVWGRGRRAPGASRGEAAGPTGFASACRARPRGRAQERATARRRGRGGCGVDGGVGPAPGASLCSAVQSSVSSQNGGAAAGPARPRARRAGRARPRPAAAGNAVKRGRRARAAAFRCGARRQATTGMASAHGGAVGRGGGPPRPPRSAWGQVTSQGVGRRRKEGSGAVRAAPAGAEPAEAALPGTGPPPCRAPGPAASQSRPRQLGARRSRGALLLAGGVARRRQVQGGVPPAGGRGRGQGQQGAHCRTPLPHSCVPPAETPPPRPAPAPRPRRSLVEAPGLEGEPHHLHRHDREVLQARQVRDTKGVPDHGVGAGERRVVGSPEAQAEAVLGLHHVVARGVALQGERRAG
jgi:hypothetical protein